MKKNQKFLRQESIALFKNTETTNETILPKNCNTNKKDKRNQMMQNLCSQIKSFDESGGRNINNKLGKATGITFPVIFKYTYSRHISWSLQKYTLSTFLRFRFR